MSIKDFSTDSENREVLDPNLKRGASNKRGQNRLREATQHPTREGNRSYPDDHSQ